MSEIQILGVIPARLGSTRLPRKVLRQIAGKPMVEWVWLAATQSGTMNQVVVATDSTEVADACRQSGIPAIMTSPDCQSGTDRVHEVSRQIDAQIYVNIQGDEPLLTPAHFAPLLALFGRPEVQVATISVPCPPDDIANPNAVKVVAAPNGRALYFSRSTIPFDRDKARDKGRDKARDEAPDSTGFSAYRKHLGLYAYRKAALEQFAALAPSALERIERLEQLRLLENGIDLYVGQAHGDTIGVDTEEDLQRVDAILKSR